MDRIKLLTVLSQGPATGATISETFHVRRTTATNALRRLHKQGLLWRRKVPGRTKPSFEYAVTPRGERALQSRRLPAEVRLLLRKVQELRVLRARWLWETDLDMIAWFEWEMSRVTGEIRALTAFVSRWLPHLNLRQLMMAPARTYFRDITRLEETLLRVQTGDSLVSWLPTFRKGPARAGFVRRDSEGKTATSADGIPEFDLTVPGFFIGELGLRYVVGPKGDLVTDEHGTPVLARIVPPPSNVFPEVRNSKTGTSLPEAAPIVADGRLERRGSPAEPKAHPQNAKRTPLEELLGAIQVQRQREREALVAEFARKPAEEQRLIVETWKTKGLVPNRDSESLRSLVLSGALFP